MPKKRERQYTKRRSASGGKVHEAIRKNGTIAYQVRYNGLHIRTYDTREEAEARLELERKNDVREVLR